MPKLTEHCSKVQYEHSDVLVVFTVPPVAFWQVRAMLYIHLQIRSSSFLFHLFRTQQKMSAAFGIWKLRRFILEMIFKTCLSVCVFLCLLGLQGMRCGCAQLMEHRGVQGGIRNVTTKPEFVPQDDLMHSHNIWIS